MRKYITVTDYVLFFLQSYNRQGRVWIFKHLIGNNLEQLSESTEIFIIFKINSNKLRLSKLK